MLNIVFVIDDMSTGGAQRVVSILSKFFLEKGNTVKILLTQDNNNFAYSEGCLSSLILPLSKWHKQKPKVSNLRLKYLFYKTSIHFQRDPQKQDFMEYIFNRKSSDKSISKSLLKSFNNIKPDIVYSFLDNSNIIVGCIAKKTHAKVVIAHRNYPDNPYLTEWYKRYRDHWYQKADVCVFQTVEQSKAFPLSIQKKAVIIPNPVKTDLPNAYYGERQKVIVNTCGYKQHKNQQVLISAFSKIEKKYPDYVLRIYGYGNTKEQIEKQANSLGIGNKVELLPFESDIHEKIKDCAMFVMTSDYEGMPNALIEAMAIGLPVVSTDCLGGGAKALIKNNINGIICPIGDASAVANAIEKLIENPEKAELLGKNAVDIREKLSADKIADKWISLL